MSYISNRKRLLFIQKRLWPIFIEKTEDKEETTNSQRLQRLCEETLAVFSSIEDQERT